MRRLAMVSEGMSLAFPLSQVAIQEAVCSELHGQAWRGILLKLLPPPPRRHYCTTRLTSPLISLAVQSFVSLGFA